MIIRFPPLTDLRKSHAMATRLTWWRRFRKYLTRGWE
jgi:hypothetical protein